MQQDAKKKSRLGRGLSSLMGMNAPADQASDFARDLPVHQAVTGDIALPLPGIGELSVPRGTPADLPIDQIDPNPHQPRRTFTEANLAELAESIKSNGVIQPIVVKPVGDRFQIIAGERRLRASKLAGLSAVPAIIRDANELAQAQMALVENIQREDLNPLDRAAGYRTLIHELGVSQTELAGRLGEERTTITNHLRLLDLQPSVQTHIREGRLSLGHAKVLAGITDAVDQVELAEQVVADGLSVRGLEKLLSVSIDPAAEQGDKVGAVKPSAHLKELELNLSKQLGLRVQVRTGAAKSKGKVVIHYGSLDEFDQLVERLGVTLDE